jgi:hypothetical protein
MSGNFVKRQKEETYITRKKYRLEMLPRTKSYPLNPARQYEKDCDMVIRAIGRFIFRRGFRPNTSALSFAHTWSETATKQYLEDLFESGYLEVYRARVWDLSVRGWDYLGVVPVIPIIPPELSFKASTPAEMRLVVKRHGTPELVAEYEAFRLARHDHVHPNSVSDED